MIAGKVGAAYSGTEGGEGGAGGAKENEVFQALEDFGVACVNFLVG